MVYGRSALGARVTGTGTGGRPRAAFCLEHAPPMTSSAVPAKPSVLSESIDVPFAFGGVIDGVPMNPGLMARNHPLGRERRRHVRVVRVRAPTSSGPVPAARARSPAPSAL